MAENDDIFHLPATGSATEWELRIRLAMSQAAAVNAKEAGVLTQRLALLEERQNNLMDNQDQLETNLKALDTSLTATVSDLYKVFLLKVEFQPYKLLMQGLTGLILAGFIGAVLKMVWHGA